MPRSSRQIEAIGEKGVEGRQRTRRVCAGYRFPAAMSQRCFSVRTVIASLAGPAFSIGLPQPPRQEHAIAVDLWPSRDRHRLNHALSSCRTQQCDPWFESTATLPPMARRLPRCQNSVESGNVRSFGRQVTARTGRSFELSKVDSEFPNLEASLAEVRRLREENARLRSLLIEHSVRIPEIPSTTAVSQTPRTISAAPDVRRSALGTAE